MSSKSLILTQSCGRWQERNVANRLRADNNTDAGINPKPTNPKINLDFSDLKDSSSGNNVRSRQVSIGLERNIIPLREFSCCSCVILMDMKTIIAMI